MEKFHKTDIWVQILNILQLIDISSCSSYIRMLLQLENNPFFPRRIKADHTKIQSGFRGYTVLRLIHYLEPDLNFHQLHVEPQSM